MQTKLVKYTIPEMTLGLKDLEGRRYYQVVESLNADNVGTIVLTEDDIRITDDNRVGIVVHNAEQNEWMFLTRQADKIEHYRFVEVKHGEVIHRW